MTGQQLRNSILQEAIQGRLVPNVLQPGEKTGEELLKSIIAERQKKENEEKGKKAKKLTLSAIEEEPWELPEGWCWCKLRDVGEFTRGNGIKKDEVTPEGYPCVRYGELYTRYKVQFSSVVSHVNESIYNKAQKIETGDVVMALTGENEYDIALASVYLGTTPIAMGGDMTKLHSYCLDSKYLVYAINSPYGIECKSLLATGQIIVHISNDKLASIQIPIPPLSIQHRIVAKIEELLPLVDEYDKAAGELETLNKILPDKLRKSVLQEAIHGNLVPNDIPEGEATGAELLQQILKERQEKENKEKGKKARKLTLSTIEDEPWGLPEGWCWCLLKDLCAVKGGKRIPAGRRLSDIDTGYKYIRVSDMKNGSVITTDLKYVPVDIVESIKRYTISKDDIYITVAGTIGDVGTIPEELDGANLTENADKLVFTIIDKHWLYWFLKTPFIIQQIRDVTTKVGQPKLAINKIEELYIPLPPLSIQHRIVEKIEEVFAAIDNLPA